MRGAGLVGWTPAAGEARRHDLTAPESTPASCDRKWNLDQSRLPRHVAVIMDGNGRWARAHGLPRNAGHRAGLTALRELLEGCREVGIRVVTVYAFSTENWRRPTGEVDFLMHLCEEMLEKELDRLAENGVRLRVLGDPSGLPDSLRERVAQAVKRTENQDRFFFNVALNYGGRAEIVRAAREIARRVAAGTLSPEAVDEALFAACLDTAGLVDPDLVIRTGGEHRLSNFLLWQAAYAEFWVTPVYWPDFRRPHLFEAIHDYQHRERRFGGLPTR